MPPTPLLALSILLFAPDAHAWGLQTHVFFAQHVLVAAPLAGLAWRHAAARLPQLVLAGACLPDLVVTGPLLRTGCFRGSHGWDQLRRLAVSAACDEDRALALGYASHLLADVVAHNHFVPENERRIADAGPLTHAVVEWAMDEHVSHALIAQPAEMLGAERAAVAQFVARGFRCGTRNARRAIDLLARGEGALRVMRIPALCRRLVARLDRHCAPRFDAWMRATLTRMAHLDALLDGLEPVWDAAPEQVLRPAHAWRRGRLALPRHPF